MVRKAGYDPATSCTPSTRSAWLSYVLMKVFRARICLRDIADEPVARIATLARISRDFYYSH